MKLHLRDNKENLIYLGLWLILFLAPVLSQYIRTNSNSTTFLWTDILHVWKIYAIYLIVFVIHNIILAPLLIYKHKKTMYVATTVCLITVCIIFQCMQRPKDFRPMDNMGPNHGMMMGRDRGPEGSMPPEFRSQNIKKGQPSISKPDRKPDGQMNGQPGERRPDEKNGRGKMPPFFFGQIDIINTIMIISLLGMNLGVKLYFKSDNDTKAMQQLEKQNLQQQLEYLKYQINPHFFMNTLNNIHALVDIDPEKAKTTILELSKMMRYILYEGNKTLIPIQREIQFLNNYITLMRLRYTDKVKIKIDIPDNIPDKGVPPLMLITFVENAFKHGVSYKDESYINVEMRFIGDRFYFGCQNSKHAESTEQHGGVGLTNVRKRLNLIYGDKFTLDIIDKPDTYEVKLDIPLNKAASTERTPQA